MKRLSATGIAALCVLLLLAWLFYPGIASDRQDEADNLTEAVDVETRGPALSETIGRLVRSPIEWKSDLDIGEATATMASIRGKVTDCSGLPLSAAAVYLQQRTAFTFDARVDPVSASQSRIASAEAGDDGEFEFSDLAPGLYDLVVEYGHFREAAFDVPTGSFVIVRVGSGSSLSGNLICESHEISCFESMQILLRPYGARWPTARVDVQPDGSFSFSGLRIGRYSLSLESADHFARTIKEVQIRTEGSSLPISIHVLSGAKLTGRVTDEEGTPVSGVAVCSNALFNASTTYTGEDGSYLIENYDFSIPRYLLGPVYFSHPNYSPTSMYPPQASRSADVTLPDVTLSRGVAITGRVVSDESDMPLQATISITGYLGQGGSKTRYSHLTSVVRSDEEGHFVFCWPKDLGCVMDIHCASFSTRRLSYESRHLQQDLGTISLNNKHQYTIYFLDAGNRPLQGWWAQARRANTIDPGASLASQRFLAASNLLTDSRTDSAGRLFVDRDSSTDDIHLYIRPPGGGTAWEHTVIPTDWDSGRATVRLDDIVRIHGYVIDEIGLGVPDQYVYVESSPVAKTSEAGSYTDQYGYFQIIGRSSAEVLTVVYIYSGPGLLGEAVTQCNVTTSEPIIIKAKRLENTVIEVLKSNGMPYAGVAVVGELQHSGETVLGSTDADGRAVIGLAEVARIILQFPDGRERVSIDVVPGRPYLHRCTD